MNITKDKFLHLIEKYNINGPRYTSYPTSLNFKENFNGEIKPSKDSKFSLYIHFPYCDKKCYYCGCNSKVSSDPSKYDQIIDGILREIDLLNIDTRNSIESIHIGGGSPSLLSNLQLETLVSKVNLKKLREFSIELNPSQVDKNKIQFYHSIGINRLSFGIEDFDKKVLGLIGRNISYEYLSSFMKDTIRANFKSINFDLVYGLPGQNETIFKETLSKVIELKPDRIAIYNFAYLPKSFPHHANININDLPQPATKLNLINQAIDKLLSENYQYIGMDHFSLKSDALYKASQNGTLKRTFMGYTDAPEENYIGIGPSAISYYNNSYFQNIRDLDKYLSTIDKNVRPIFRGITLNEDDLKIKSIINDLTTKFEVTHNNINEHFNKLKPFQDDNLIIINRNSIQVTELGKFFIRNIAMVFDKYLKQNATDNFSKTI